MQGKIISVNDQSITVKEYKGRRVVTFKDIDTVHERADGTARKRFNDNRKHFIEGEDFFKISPSEFRTTIGEMDLRQQNDVTLITESGYLMLVKSFTDDLAWDVQRQLVKKYFTPEPVHTTITYQYPVPAVSLESATNAGRLFERIMRSEGVPPHEIAMAVRSIFLQAGIDIPSYVVKPPAYEQLTLDVVMNRA